MMETLAKLTASRFITLLAVALAGAAVFPATGSSAVFYARASSGGSFECLMSDSPGPAYAHHVVCISVGHVKGGDKLLMREVTLTPHGGVSVCTAVGSANPQHCNFGNPDENTPTYHAGKVVDEGRFRCKVLSPYPAVTI